MLGTNACDNIVSNSHCCLDSGEYMCTPVKMAVAATMMSGIIQVAMGVYGDSFLDGILDGILLSGMPLVLTPALA
jgi:hypothetical protein